MLLPSPRLLTFCCARSGECKAAACVCDKPWTGPTCGTLGYAVTPSSGKNVYTVNGPSNTWNGPIVGPEADGLYHIYVPLYKAGSLGGAKEIKHGLASHPAGPYAWNVLPDIASSENPAFLTFPDPITGKKTYSLWNADGVLTSNGVNGTFTKVRGVS